MECEVTNDAFKLRMVLQEVEKLEGYIPTIGVDFANKLVNVEGTAVNVQVWDTAGQERFRSLITPFFRQSKAYILTVNLSESLPAQTEEVCARSHFIILSHPSLQCFAFMVYVGVCA